MKNSSFIVLNSGSNKWVVNDKVIKMTIDALLMKHGFRVLLIAGSFIDVVSYQVVEIRLGEAAHYKQKQQ